MTTLKQCVATVAAEGKSAGAILAAAREWHEAQGLKRAPSVPDGADHFLLSREWQAVRYKALEKHGGRCHACGRTADDGIVINVDHIKPRAKYPELALTISNLQVLCNECNCGKGNRFQTDWRPAPATTNAPA